MIRAVVARTLALLLVAAAWSPRPVRADAVVGTGTADSCTELALDAALAAGGNVTFNCGTSPVTITVTSTKTVSADTTIDGGSLITIDGGDSVGVFSVNAGVNFTVQNLTIANGTAGSGGGGIYNGGTLEVTNSTFSGNSAYLGGGGISSSGTLEVTNSIFSGNTAAWGGGISSNGRGTVTNSTFSGNSAGEGGGIDNTGTLTVTNSTFSGNSADLGGGISNGGILTVTLTNTIVANSTGGNCLGVTDGGHNLDDGGTCFFSMANGSLSDANPNLDPEGLADNGGPTQTIALRPGSPAINAGSEAVCAASPVNNLDQRGYGRPGAGATSCSIGAYEYNSVPDCCQCPTSCAPPINGSCGDCIPVAGATCESGDLCVLHTPTPTRTVTPRPTATATPTVTPTPAITPTPTPATTNTPAANDCRQCPDFCSAPIVGTCGACAVVFGASCIGGSSSIPGTPTQTATASVTFTATAAPTPTPTASQAATPTLTPSRTKTPTWTPNTTPTWTPQETGCLYTCRGGNWHGQPCGRDADCPGGQCTWGSHRRVCLNVPHCVLSGGLCGDHVDCPRWPAEADYCPYQQSSAWVIDCNTDSDCGVCNGGAYKGLSCTTDANCPSSTCATGTGKCVNGLPQGQNDGFWRGAGAEGDLAADYIIGDDCIEADMNGAPTASSMGLVTGVGVDPVAGRLYVSQMGERGRISIFPSVLPASSSAASWFLNAYDAEHLSWAQIMGDLTIPDTGYLAVPAMNALNGTAAKGHVIRDPVNPIVWVNNGYQIWSFPDDVGTDGVANPVTLGGGGANGSGIFSAIAIKQRCKGGSAAGLRCLADTDCTGGGVCAVTLAAADAGNARVLVWTDLEDVTTAQDADIILPTGGQQMGLAFDNNGDLYVSDQSNNQIKIYAHDFGPSSTPYAILGGSGAPSALTLNSPGGIDVDSVGDLAVADQWNYRVLWYPGPLPHANGQSATKVFGQADFVTNDWHRQSSNGTACDRVWGPVDVSFTPDNDLWVADSYNYRALRLAYGWNSVNASASTLLGQSTCASSTYQTVDGWTWPKGNWGGMTFFANGAVNGMVACDSPDNRCKVYNDWTTAKGRAEPDAMLGQTDFTSSAPNQGGSVTTSTLYSPGIPAADASSVYIPDGGNNRVQRFTLGSSPNRLTTDQSASASIGGSCTSPPSATSMCGPTSAAVDVEGNLLVVDQGDGRVTLFCRVPGTHGGVCTSSNSSDWVADDVYGKATLSTALGTSCTSPTASTLCSPQQVAFLTINSQLYMLVTDHPNVNGGRVVGFSYPGTVGAHTATLVWGVRGSSFQLYDYGGIFEIAGTNCTRLSDSYWPPDDTTSDHDYCDWSWAPFVYGPETIAVAADGQAVYVGGAGTAVEYRAPFTLTGMKASRVGGVKFPHNFGGNPSGYVMHEWSGAGPIALAPNGDLLVVQEGSENLAGIYGVINPEYTYTPTPGGPTFTRTPTQTVPPTSTPKPCAGDCNNDGTVTVDEILTMVNIALGNTSVTTCEAGDPNHDGQITVDEILTAVNNALNGCGGNRGNPSQ